MKIKFFIVIIAVLSATTLKAQNERLVTQLKNGTAPGLLFDRSALVVKPIETVEQKESLIQQIRKGTAPGMKFMQGAANLNVTSSAAQRTQAGQLASELPIKIETLKIATAPPVIPNQEEVKQ